MSKIGKQPVPIPQDVTVTVHDDSLEVKGKNGTLSVRRSPEVGVEIKDNQIVFTPLRNSKQAAASWGTMRALAANAVLGASQDFTKELVIEGVGYRAAVEGQEVVLNLGFSHPIRFKIPDGIAVAVEKNEIKVSGAHKQSVGQVAAQIRKFRKPEPYKGKGIRYKDEVIRRKAGKKVAGTTT